MRNETQLNNLVHLRDVAQDILDNDRPLRWLDWHLCLFGYYAHSIGRPDIIGQNAHDKAAFVHRHFGMTEAHVFSFIGRDHPALKMLYGLGAYAVINRIAESIPGNSRDRQAAHQELKHRIKDIDAMIERRRAALGLTDVIRDIAQIAA